MTTRTLNLDDSLYQYLLDVSLRDSPVKARLRAETARLPMSRWQVAPEQGQFLALLVGLTGAKRILEVGTFTGYSACAWPRRCPKAAISSAATCRVSTTTLHAATGTTLASTRASSCGSDLHWPPWKPWLRAISKVLSTWYSSTPTRRITSPTWSTRWLCCVWAAGGLRQRTVEWTSVGGQPGECGYPRDPATQPGLEGG